MTNISIKPLLEFIIFIIIALIYYTLKYHGIQDLFVGLLAYLSIKYTQNR